MVSGQRSSSVYPHNKQRLSPDLRPELRLSRNSGDLILSVKALQTPSVGPIGPDVKIAEGFQKTFIFAIGTHRNLSIWTLEKSSSSFLDRFRTLPPGRRCWNFNGVYPQRSPTHHKNRSSLQGAPLISNARKPSPMRPYFNALCVP